MCPNYAVQNCGCTRALHVRQLTIQNSVDLSNNSTKVLILCNARLNRQPSYNCTETSWGGRESLEMAEPALT